MTEHRHGGHGNRHHGQRRRSGKSRNMPRIAESPVAVLIGMPGAGKTRVGGEVAQMLGVRFTDSDEVIEQRAGMRITEYFSEYGEPKFRELESQVIADLLHTAGGIVSLGGGAPMPESVRRNLQKYISQGGKVVYLQADPQEAMERARRGGNRPMLAGDADARWRALYEERDPVFDAVANVHVHTRGSSPQHAARKVMDMVMEHDVHVTGTSITPYDVRIGVVLIPDAEAGKTIEVANGIWQRLGNEGFTRSDAVVGLGGGAATDLAGFVAATWMRGIRYVNCPTSLLAMVDASTGGKTGINTPQGKNLVGSFYTPAGVLADMRTLETLPNDIFIEGLGEVAKSGFIRDPEILSILENHAQQLREFNGSTFLGSPLEDVVAELIERTVKVKAYHVSNDLREAGLREFLNYGHTLGHAIEQIEHFKWRHGNAVAVGCVFAAELSSILGYIDQDLVDYHRQLLGSLGLPISWSGGDWDSVLTLMHRDKKARGNTLRFVVLEGVGHPIHLDDPPIEAVHEAFERIRSAH